MTRTVSGDSARLRNAARQEHAQQAANVVIVACPCHLPVWVEWTVLRGGPDPGCPQCGRGAVSE